MIYVAPKALPNKTEVSDLVSNSARFLMNRRRNFPHQAPPDFVILDLHGAFVERNLVYNHDRTGIAAVPFPEDDANDVPPPKSDWDKPCNPKKKVDPANANPGLVLWNGTDNRVIGNDVSNSKLADLASATIPDEAKGITVESLNNCFSDNTFKTSSPTDIETLAPCKGTGSGDWSKGNFDLTVLIADKAPAPPKNTYRSSPIPAAQPNMPNATTAPAPVFKGPKKPDVASIQVPEKPAG